MTTLEYCWLMLLMTIATFICRSFFLTLGSGVKLSPWIRHALQYAPATALAAILAPDLFLANGSMLPLISNLKLISALCAALYFMLTRQMVGTIVFGMLCFTGLRIFLA
jgi:branched-subunit amino acid transport protein